MSGIIDPMKRLGKSSLLFEHNQIGAAAMGCASVKGIFELSNLTLLVIPVVFSLLWGSLLGFE
jgi:hypothetical protein